MKEIIHGDAVKWAKKYNGELFHALFCDSPYHLTTIIKRYGRSNPDDVEKNAVKRKTANQGTSPYGRAARGFMGQQWDGGDVAFRPETWTAFMQVLHPGAFGMTFAGSRGWHRLAVAIEDAGFIIHPSIFGWSYGSGFPKATNPSEAFKAERGVIRAWKGKTISNDAMLNMDYQTRLYWYRYEKSFKGHRYGLQALKPALEPIIVFQKPYEGRPIDNITETGAGVLNIEAGRIGYEEGGSLASNPSLRTHINAGNGGNIIAHEDNRRVVIPDSVGRWPSNFILLDEAAAQALDRQSGRSVSNSSPRIRDGNGSELGQSSGWNKHKNKPSESVGFGDEGGASRFFFQVQEQIDSADPVYYEAKAGQEERDVGLRKMPEYKHRSEWATIQDARPHKKPGYVYDGKPVRNPHPTVKPLSLTRYLASLLLPPAEYSPRRLFVPFAGVASEMIGAMQAGWDEIIGVELTESYIPIARARIEYWRNRGWQTELFSFRENEIDTSALDG